MTGRTGRSIRRLEQQMTDAAEEMEYERAARLRDDIEALKKAMEKNAVVLADATDADLIGRRQGRAGSRRADLPRARRPGARPARLGHRQGGGRHHR